MALFFVFFFEPCFGVLGFEFIRPSVAQSGEDKHLMPPGSTPGHGLKDKTTGHRLSIKTARKVLATPIKQTMMWRCVIALYRE